MKTIGMIGGGDSCIPVFDTTQIYGRRAALYAMKEL